MNLKKFYCEVCGKLLCKGTLKDEENQLEVKCRGCKTVCFFQGPDAEILKRRSELIRKGLIPDPEKS